MKLDTFTLNNGIEIPCIGYGTYKVVGEDSKECIKMALEAGYRYFDTASFLYTIFFYKSFNSL